MSEQERFEVVSDDGESIEIVLIPPDDIDARHMGDPNKKISRRLGSYETIDGVSCMKMNEDSFMIENKVFRRKP